uniref:BZIP domain-containing protein n=1 Tax=Rhabditophanes sp. KR3021 TaxID=114890 RepID=A0AC35TT00_9BILA
MFATIQNSFLDTTFVQPTFQVTADGNTPTVFATSENATITLDQLDTGSPLLPQTDLALQGLTSPLACATFTTALAYGEEQCFRPSIEQRNVPTNIVWNVPTIWQSTTGLPTFMYCSCCGSGGNRNNSMQNQSTVHLRSCDKHHCSKPQQSYSPPHFYYETPADYEMPLSLDGSYNFSSTSSPSNQFQWIDALILETKEELKAETHIPSNLKRKTSSVSSDTSSGCCSSCSCDSSCACGSKKSKKYSLRGLTAEEIAMRKKEQNKVAAQRYRQKQKEVTSAESQEISFLTQRNAVLIEQATSLEKEIDEMKALMMNYMR